MTYFNTTSYGDGFGSKQARPSLSLEEQKRNWLTHNLSHVGLRPNSVSDSDKALILDNYKILTSAMQGYNNWINQSMAEGTSACKKEHIAYQKTKKALESSYKKLNQINNEIQMSTLKPPSSSIKGSAVIRLLPLNDPRSQARQIARTENIKAQKTNSIVGTAYRKCLMASKPSPIHKILAEKDGGKKAPAKFFLLAVGAAMVGASIVLFIS